LPVSLFVLTFEKSSLQQHERQNPDTRTRPFMMNKSLRARARESSRNHFYGFQRPFFRRSPHRARSRLRTFRTTRRPGNLMTWVPFIGGTLRRELGPKWRIAKKRAAVSGGFW